MAKHRTVQMPIGMFEEGAYIERLRRLVLSSLTSKGLPFDRIVRLAGGAYPTDVREALHGLVASGDVIQDDRIYRPCTNCPVQPLGGQLAEHVEVPVSRHDDVMKVSLADPHPADYDWRFTTSTLEHLAERLRPFVTSGAKIALLGITTLFPKLALSGASVTLFDRSPSLLKDLETAGFKHGLVEHDLFDPIAESFGRFHLVVADPPWYPAFHRAFILRGTEILQEGGLLFLSVLPWLARPSAVADRVKILEFASECALDLAEARAGYLLYQSPKFERIALALHDVDCADWRTGDMFVFRKVDEPSPILEAPRPEDEPTWEEYRIGNRKIKVKLRPNAQSSSFKIKSASETNRYLDSVSRRSSVRAMIDLWTSDNLAYSVEGLEVLHYALTRLAAGDSRDTIRGEAARAYGLTPEDESVLNDFLGEIIGKSQG